MFTLTLIIIYNASAGDGVDEGEGKSVGDGG